MEQLITNLKADGKIRFAKLDSVEHIVVPSIMLTVGVHNGSSGPLYYPENETRKASGSWNYRPVVVYHPEIDGQQVSACDPVILNSRSIGVVLNTKYRDRRLPSEVWINPAKADIVDERILVNVREERMTEVSTGLFTDNEMTEGEFEGKKYSAIARNHRPDHLAILPDKIGACSIKDGAGLLRLNQLVQEQPGMLERVLQHALHSIGGPILNNELSNDGLRRQLWDVLRAKFGEKAEVWVEDVFNESNRVLYSNAGKLYLQAYSVVDEVPSLSVESATEVVEKKIYTKTDGTVVLNEGDSDMDSKTLTAALIANKASGFTTADEASLLTTPVPVLTKLVENATKAKADADKAAADLEAANKAKELADKAKANDDTAAKAGDVTPVGNAAPVAPTVNWQDLVPADVKSMLDEGLSLRNAERAKLVDRITANARNKFSKEHLLTRGLDELQAIAALAGDDNDAAPAVLNHSNSYFGQHVGPEPAPVANQGGKPLMLPTLFPAKK